MYTRTFQTLKSVVVCGKTGFMNHIHFCWSYNKTDMYCLFQDDIQICCPCKWTCLMAWFSFNIGASLPTVLWHRWLGDRKGIRPVKSWVLVYWWWRFDWSFARLKAPIVSTIPLSFVPITSRMVTFWYKITRVSVKWVSWFWCILVCHIALLKYIRLCLHFCVFVLFFVEICSTFRNKHNNTYMKYIHNKQWIFWK